MGDYTPDELRDALRPMASLISKSEKAQQRLAPGTWQHTMLRDNLDALYIACDLMKKEPDEGATFAREDLEEALRAFASMMGRTEKAHAKSSPGTSQHALLRNRLHALRIAATFIEAELER